MAPPSYLGVVLLAVASLVQAWPYDPAQLDYNLNQNPSATHPKDYWGTWENHEYNPSPSNWRFPYYTVRGPRSKICTSITANRLSFSSIAS